ncbi:hypothetical protein TESG_08351 [Trichophyton tonsurans CBS 112818]|uniref:Uncharacterized protein n=1 Tax=Trichophyton tonsurans (strain CBS 112818) TaxID=647933 RepID=F2RU24_TRIT1|nr:hypothetical protein TESG_08351 [Trichophyton tonsurans CBS 112818]
MKLKMKLKSNFSFLLRLQAWRLSQAGLAGREDTRQEEEVGEEEDEDKYSVEGEEEDRTLQLYSPTSTATTLLDTDESATGIVKRRRESLLSATLQEGKGRERERLG